MLPVVILSAVGPPEQVLVTDDEEVDEAALRSQLGELGYELRRKRARRGVFAKNDGVEGKTKLTVHLTDDLRKDIKWASVTLDVAESDIAQEAFSDWLEKKALSQPGR